MGKPKRTTEEKGQIPKNLILIKQRKRKIKSSIVRQVKRTAHVIDNHLNREKSGEKSQFCFEFNSENVIDLIVKTE